MRASAADRVKAQQVGASIGTAVLSSIVAGAATAYAGGKPRTPQLPAQAAVHGYTVAFWIAAGVFAVGGLLVGGMMRSIRVEPKAAPAPQPEAVAA